MPQHVANVPKTEIGPNGEVIPTTGFDQLDAGVLEMSQNHELTAGADIGGVDDIPSDELGLGGDVVPNPTMKPKSGRSGQFREPPEDTQLTKESKPVKYLTSGLKQGLPLAALTDTLLGSGVRDGVVSAAIDYVKADVTKASEAKGANTAQMLKVLGFSKDSDAGVGYVELLASPLLPPEDVDQFEKEEKVKADAYFAQDKADRVAAAKKEIDATNPYILTAMAEQLTKDLTVFDWLSDLTSNDKVVAAKVEQNALNIANAQAQVLTNFGVDAEIGQDGLVYANIAGEYQLITQDTLPSIGGYLAANGIELGASIGVGMYAFNKTPGNLATKTVVSVAASAASAGLGRGMDAVKNSFVTGDMINSRLLIKQMYDSAVWDASFGILGEAVINTLRVGGKGSVRMLVGLKDAWTSVSKKNWGGAQEIFERVFGYSQEQAKAKVKQMSDVLGVVPVPSEGPSGVLEFTRKAGKAEELSIMGTLVRTEPGGESIINAIRDQGGILLDTIAGEIDARAKDFKKIADRMTTENLKPVVFKALEDYELKAYTDFGAAKRYASNIIDKTNYSFDYAKVSLEPLERSAAKTITNDADRAKLQGILGQAQLLGAYDLDIVATVVKRKEGSTLAKSKLTGSGVEESVTTSNVGTKGTSREIEGVRTNALRAGLGQTTESLSSTSKQFVIGTDKTVDSLKRTESSASKTTQQETASDTLTRTRSTKVLDVTSGNRSFTNLLELRRLVNSLKDMGSSSAVNVVKANIDAEIARAAKLYLPESSKWLKEWKIVNKQWQQFKTSQLTALYKATINPAIDNNTIVGELVDSISASSASSSLYKDYLAMLPDNTRRLVDGKVMQTFIAKSTAGEIGEGFRHAINFPHLAEQLKDVKFYTKESRELHRVINDFATIFKNDVRLGASTGQLKVLPEQNTLAATPTGRMAVALTRNMFQYLQQFGTSDKGKTRALVNQISLAIKDPLNHKNVSKVLKELPPDPEMESAIKAAQIEFAKRGEDDLYPKALIYDSTGEQGARTPKDTIFGHLIEYSTEKSAGKATRLVDGNLLADMSYIEKKLGVTGLKPEHVKLDSRILELLKRDGREGITYKNKVYIFP